jgi:hypothetical protein
MQWSHWLPCLLVDHCAHLIGCCEISLFSMVGSVYVPRWDQLNDVVGQVYWMRWDQFVEHHGIRWLSFVGPVHGLSLDQLTGFFRIRVIESAIVTLRIKIIPTVQWDKWELKITIKLGGGQIYQHLLVMQIQGRHAGPSLQDGPQAWGANPGWIQVRLSHTRHSVHPIFYPRCFCVGLHHGWCMYSMYWDIFSYCILWITWIKGCPLHSIYPLIVNRKTVGTW